MGILDAPVASTTATHLALVTSRLQANNENVVLTVLGDSTGVTIIGTQVRWTYLVAQQLAARYPAYTVKHYAWNDTNQNYDAPLTIQTGTGAYTLSIYNGSTSGQTPGYSLTRIALQIPVAPHCIIVNYGHNDTNLGSIYRGTQYALTRLIADWFPAAGLVCIAQNPRAKTDNGSGYAAGWSADLSRQQAIIDLCGSEGYGLVNVLQAFLNTPSFGTTLLNPDAIHPNDSAGSPLWAALVMRQFDASVGVSPRAATLSPHRIFMPANAFMASEGSPTLAVVGPSGGEFPAWAFDQTTQQGIVATVDFPDTWLTFNTYIQWAFAIGSGYTGSNNTVKWGVGRARHGVTVGTPFDSPTASRSLSGRNNYNEVTNVDGATNGGAWGHRLMRGSTSDSATFRSMGLRIRRIAADASDTLAESAYLLGVFVERAS